ncbi:MAG: Ig-like domain-containing protein [Bacteroidetes bacterium]|nr:Ig-like domain-containing protein [Bacteroidota bacterium]
MIRKYGHVLLAFSLFLLVRCAHQVSPSGGEEDRIPPTVVDAYPVPGTTNYNDNYFEITFSEYVQKGSVREAIFISPNIDGNIQYSWSGKSLTIEFEDSLKKNTTYTVTIGTDVQDYNNRNKMAEAYQIVFSTGDVIDTGEISGQVYDSDPSGVMVYAYLQADSLINPITTKPDYISQVGKNGRFTLRGLADGEYQVFAIRDDFRDFLYNVGEDSYGAPFSKLELSDSNHIIFNHDFKLTKEDTIPPNILSVTMTDEAHLLVEFSEFVDSAAINDQNVFVYDSTANIRHNIKHVYRGSAKPQHQFITISDSLIEENENYLIMFSLSDMNKNVLEMSSTLFTVNDKPDTTAAMISNVETEYNNRLMDFSNAFVKITLDDGVDISDQVSLVNLIFNEDYIPITVEYLDDCSFIVRPLKELKPDAGYELKVDLNFVRDSKGNKVDSVFTSKLKTKNKLDFTGVSGRISSEKIVNTLVVLENIEDKKRVYTTSADSVNVYNFPRVVPGKYIIWSFMDADSNNKYTNGSIFPYGSSERFTYYSDTLDVKARWPVGDVDLEFN